MKKRRGIFWRWLLALFLGAGTWWGVGWWLSPRLLFETKYFVSDAINRAKDAQTIRANADGAQVSMGIRWFPRIWDVTGRYLLIEEKLYDNVNFLDVIDLKTGTKLARHSSYPTPLELSSLKKTNNLAAADGTIFLIKTISGYEINEEGQKDAPFQLVRSMLNRELWKWNLLTNEASKIRKFPMKSTRSICPDGKSMLEVEQVTPMLPSLILPSSLPDILSALAHADLGTNDLAVMRIYSLPELAHRGTVILPWMERQDNVLLSRDGQYLIVPDSATLEGFTSPTRFHTESIEGPGRPAVSSRDLYASHPLGIRVYEVAGSKLWWESKNVAGIYRACEANTDLVSFMPEAKLFARDSGTGLLLHLPSRKTHQYLGIDDITPHDQSRLHFILIQDAGEELSANLHVMNEQGEHRKVATYDDLAEGHQLLRFAPQYLINGKAKPRTLDHFVEWLHKHNWLLSWQPVLDHELRIMDYEKNRLLWSQCYKHEPTWIISDNRLMICHQEDDVYSLWVYALPFPSWSPWWARAAGLIVLILSWHWLYTRDKGISTP